MPSALLEDLSTLPALACLSPEELAAVVPLFSIRSFAANEVVANEGAPAELFNFVLSGTVQAFWRDEEGHQLKLGIDYPGHHFPDHTICGQTSVCSHIAVSELRLATIRHTDFRALMDRYPQIAALLLTDVSERLRRLIARTKMLTMEDVYSRVVKLLMAAAVQVEGRLVSQRLTHAEIGHRVGATREMVGRVLRDLTRGGYISADDDRIAILKKLPARW
jgi:CRP/FNR family transcriptional regulator, cyclic AMP receptor protein